jgi:hypothetical protein
VFPVNYLNCSVHRAQPQTESRTKVSDTVCVTLCCQVSVKHLALCVVSSSAQWTSKHSEMLGGLFLNICRLHPCGVGIAQSVQWLLYGLEDPGSNPGRGKRYTQQVRTGSGDDPTSYSMAIGGSNPREGGKAAVAWVKCSCLVGSQAWSCNVDRHDCSGTAEVGKCQWVWCGRSVFWLWWRHYPPSSNCGDITTTIIQLWWHHYPPSSNYGNVTTHHHPIHYSLRSSSQPLSPSSLLTMIHYPLWSRPLVILIHFIIIIQFITIVQLIAH